MDNQEYDGYQIQNSIYPWEREGSRESKEQQSRGYDYAGNFFSLNLVEGTQIFNLSFFKIHPLMQFASFL